MEIGILQILLSVTTLVSLVGWVTYFVAIVRDDVKVQRIAIVIAIVFGLTFLMLNLAKIGAKIDYRTTVQTDTRLIQLNATGQEEVYYVEDKKECSFIYINDVGIKDVIKVAKDEVTILKVDTEYPKCIRVDEITEVPKDNPLWKNSDFEVKTTYILIIPNK